MAWPPIECGPTAAVFFPDLKLLSKLAAQDRLSFHFVQEKILFTFWSHVLRMKKLGLDYNLALKELSANQSRLRFAAHCGKLQRENQHGGQNCNPSNHTKMVLCRPRGDSESQSTPYPALRFAPCWAKLFRPFGAGSFAGIARWHSHILESRNRPIAKPVAQLPSAKC